MAEQMPEIPYSFETERAALGSMFMDGGAALQGCGVLTAEDFYYVPNKLLFQAMDKVVHSGVTTPDLTMVWQELERDGLAEQVGIDFLAQTVVSVGSSINLPRYIERLRELSYFRRCIHAGRTLLQAAYAQDTAALSASLGLLREDGIATECSKTAADIMAEYVAEIDQRRRRGEVFSGIQTGFVDFDLITGGLRENDFYVIAGRPAMGKTAFGLDIARGCVKRFGQEGKVALIFSLEMSERDIVARLYCGETATDNVIFSLREGDDGRWGSFLRQLGRDGDFFEEIAKNIIIDDSSYITPENIRAKCHGIRSGGQEIGLILVDYIQLMNGGKGENRTQDISHITRNLKLMAKEFHCPVIALSQLSRQVESRGDKRPMLSDLRESGSIEQDADVVMFVYRDEYYNPDTQQKNVAEIIFGKNRKGPVGTVRLSWKAASTTFRNLERSFP